MGSNTQLDGPQHSEIHAGHPVIHPNDKHGQKDHGDHAPHDKKDHGAALQPWHECLLETWNQRLQHHQHYDARNFGHDMQIHQDSPYSHAAEAMHHRTELENAARKRLSIPDMKMFEKDMAAFEKHSSCNKLEASKVSEFYAATADLMKSKGAHYSAGQKVSLATELMHHAAHPETVTQGNANTCNVSTVEYRLLVRDPQAVAKMTAQVAKDGTYTTADGTKLLDNWHSIKPDSHATGRDMLDALVQTTLVNCHWERFKSYDEDTSTYRYEHNEKKGINEIVYEFDEHGNRTEYRGDKGQIVKDPNLTHEDFRDIYNQVARTNDPAFAIQNGNPDARSDRSTSKTNDEGIYVNSQSELHEVLKKAVQENQFPVIISVHTGNNPFRKQTLQNDKDAPADDEHFGWHVISLTKYDVATHTVRTHNSWGKANDVNISLGELYQSSQKPAFWTYEQTNHFPKDK